VIAAVAVRPPDPRLVAGWVGGPRRSTPGGQSATNHPMRGKCIMPADVPERLRIGGAMSRAAKVS
jgi:hypothetical protein